MTRILNDIRDEVGQLSVVLGELAGALVLAGCGWYLITLLGAQIVR